MILAIDIGNTDIVFGIREEENWHSIWRISSRLRGGSTDYQYQLRQYLLDADIQPKSVHQAILSSVVPDLTGTIKSMCENLFGVKPLVVDPSIVGQLELGNINPHELGSDLVANAVGAFEMVNDAAIVVDFGTALTFTSVDAERKILGVAITPGVKTAMKSLSANTARLPEIPLEIPQKVIGTNTVEAMQSGIMQGYVGLVNHMVERTKAEMDCEPKVIATGGLSFIFKPLRDTFDQIEPNLTLNGLLAILKRFS